MQSFCQKGDELGIVYNDLDGQTTVRRVSVTTIFTSPKGNLLVGAYCYDAKAYRTFLHDRIISADDLTTGKRIHAKRFPFPPSPLPKRIGVQFSINHNQIVINTLS